MLCLGAVALSLPPQCGDVPITNWDWDWDSVEAEERLSGVIWGDYDVVGTYDGTAFTVLDVGPPERPQPEESFGDFPIPCPEPEGGWRASDPSRASEEDRDAAAGFAESQPDYAGLWVKILKQTPGVDVYGPDDLVLVVAFTEDIDGHRQELARVWGGPMCIVRHDRTQAELLRIQAELSSRDNGFGIQLLSSDVDVVHNRVRVEVVALDEATRVAIADHYGEGVVRLSAALRPIP